MCANLEKLYSVNYNVRYIHRAHLLKDPVGTYRVCSMCPNWYALVIGFVLLLLFWFRNMTLRVRLQSCTVCCGSSAPDARQNKYLVSDFCGKKAFCLVGVYYIIWPPLAAMTKKKIKNLFSPLFLSETPDKDFVRNNTGKKVFRRLFLALASYIFPVRLFEVGAKVSGSPKLT